MLLQARSRQDARSHNYFGMPYAQVERVLTAVAGTGSE